MVRMALIAEIERLIARHKFFEATDFSVGPSKDDEGDEIIEIAYRFNDAYFFHAWVSADGANTRESPGDLHDELETECDDRRELLKAVSLWLDRLAEEIQAEPVHRLVQEQRKALEEFMQHLQGVTDEMLTREEIEVYEEKLAQLENTLLESIKTSGIAQERMLEKIKSLEEEMDLLRTKASTVTKRAFFSAVFSKIWAFSKDPSNQKALASGAKVVAKTLIEASKSHHQLPPIQG